MPSTRAQFLILTSGIALLAIFLPYVLTLKILRLTPLISSTVNLMWAVDEYMFLSSWLSPSYRDQANALLPDWFATWSRMGSLVLFSSFPFSLGSGIANVLTSRETNAASGALKWYWAGLIFTFAHFLFAPKALKLLAAIRHGEPKGNATESMRLWIAMHSIRIAVADLPAFLAFATALLTTIQEVM